MTENKNKSQEIDLIELFSNVGNWISNLIRKILYFFVRNVIWFILFALLGAAVGFFNHKITKLYYESKMVGYSHSIRNNEVIQSINNWNYVNSFSEEDLEKIKNIEATYLLDINGDDKWDKIEDFKSIENMDTNLIKQRLDGNFCIQIEVFDTTAIPLIRKNILSFLSDNKRVIEHNKIRIKEIKELIPKIEKEILELDSLKRVDYFKKNKFNNVKVEEALIIGEKETKLYHKDILELVDKKHELERELFLNKEPYEIILDFSIPKKETNNEITLTVNFILIFLLIGFFIILLFDQRKFIKTQIKKSKIKL